MNTPIPTYTIFIITYLLIASRRLSLLPIGRPAGALFGATLMVAAGAITPEESYRAIDQNTILLLFSMMLLSAYLRRSGFFDLIAAKIATRCSTPAKLLFSVAILSGLLSAFLMNDTICLFMTPFVAALCSTYNLPFPPFLMALATSANIGSAATLVGNPQNMLIGSFSRMPFNRFLFHAGPPALLGLILNTLLLWLFYRKRLPKTLRAPSSPSPPSPIAPELPSDPKPMIPPLLATTAIVIGFFAGFHLGYTALAGVMFLIVWDRKEPKAVFAEVDWTLLVFFCSLFIVVNGLTGTGIVEKVWAAWSPYLNLTTPWGVFSFSLLLTLGSNIVSNVPLVMMAGPLLGGMENPEMGWIICGFVTTVAGNLTLIGSVANIIVAEGAKEYYNLGFWEYLKFGFLSTVLVLFAGVSLIYLLMG